jgi:metal-responsive CopG/Arc/MetJ family transcriptional regulator
MGRPKVEEPKQQYTVMLRPSVVKEIDRIAAIRGRFSRSEMIANLIELGLDDLQSLDRLGIIQAAAVGDKVFKKLKDALRSGDVKLNKNGDLEIRK